jgi:hypothetical protein
MFKTFFRMVYIGLLLVGWSLAALSLHVVRTPDKIGLIPKERIGFTDTYVDARTWTLADLSSHPDLVKRVLEANKADLFRYLADPSNNDVAGQLQGAVNQPAPVQKVSSVFDRARGLFIRTAAPRQSSAANDSLSLPVDF